MGPPPLLFPQEKDQARSFIQCIAKKKITKDFFYFTVLICKGLKALFKKRKKKEKNSGFGGPSPPTEVEGFPHHRRRAGGCPPFKSPEKPGGPSPGRGLGGGGSGVLPPGPRGGNPPHPGEKIGGPGNCKEGLTPPGGASRMTRWFSDPPGGRRGAQKHPPGAPERGPSGLGGDPRPPFPKRGPPFSPLLGGAPVKSMAPSGAGGPPAPGRKAYLPTVPRKGRRVWGLHPPKGPGFPKNFFPPGFWGSRFGVFRGRFKLGALFPPPRGKRHPRGCGGALFEPPPPK